MRLNHLIFSLKCMQNLPFCHKIPVLIFIFKNKVFSFKFLNKIAFPARCFIFSGFMWACFPWSLVFLSNLGCFSSMHIHGFYSRNSVGWAREFTFFPRIERNAQWALSEDDSVLIISGCVRLRCFLLKAFLCLFCQRSVKSQWVEEQGNEAWRTVFKAFYFVE